MKHARALVIALLLAPLAARHAQSSQNDKDPAGSGYAVASRLDEFLGAPVFVPMQSLWKGRGGWGGILTAQDGTVVAFQSPGGGNCRRSRDGGLTWDPVTEEFPVDEQANRLLDRARREPWTL